MVTTLGIVGWFSKAIVSGIVVLYFATKAIVYGIVVLYFATFWILPASFTLVALGESRDLYGSDISRVITPSVWVLLVVYAALALAGLRGLGPGRVVGALPAPFALVAVLLAPIGVIVILRELLLLATTP
ncbi:MAG: hypothetical protein J4N69_03585 [Chloroflexi bacterium]|nr:hypothetical protein [Chloroflexota bacterium]MCI0801450.1 hypothetical protein [Chloroflexota bacterium]MCI0829609.1 hypothetical protein [Chloroflexota bacterium]MCI0863299.1 hypothetical protein [Chloroflexota bacterium]MCI0899018.1 hypothetical protein [Chloroflexota bacterium]